MVGTEFSWLNLVPSAISAALTVGMFQYGQHVERKKKERASKSEGARMAFAVLDTLLEATSAVINIKKTIDQEFELTKARHLEVGMELHSRVRWFLPPSVENRHVDPLHIMFLLKANNQELFADVRQVGNKLNSLQKLIENFNESKRELTKAMEHLWKGASDLRPEGATLEMNDRDAKSLFPKEAMANSLLGLIIESVEEDGREFRGICERFVSAAIEEFGDDFKVKKLQWKVS